MASVGIHRKNERNESKLLNAWGKIFSKVHADGQMDFGPRFFWAFGLNMGSGCPNLNPKA